MCIVRAEDAEVKLVKLTSVDKTRGYFEILLNNADVDVLENSSQSAEFSKTSTSALLSKIVQRLSLKLLMLEE